MRLSGSITALATPFTADGRLDTHAWQRLIERQIAGGTSALVVAGSTGEAAMLDADEYSTLIREAVTVVDGRVPVLAGSGASGTDATIRQTRLAAAQGIDAALVVTPPYVRPTQSGLIAHFTAVAERSEVPVVLYNVPSRTAGDLQPATVAELALHPNIIGIKEAVADEARVAALLPLRNDGFTVLSGDDPSACRSMLAGADGCISVASNAVPAAFARLCAAAMGGDMDGANSIDAQLAALYAFLGAEPNPTPVKALLAAMSLCANELRLPLQRLSTHHEGALADVVANVVELERCYR
ncbi:MAG: 4-hydroxy-tetrahydrodipicolinate synthase [Lysobacteraceae bacterium]